MGAVVTVRVAGGVSAAEGLMRAIVRAQEPAVRDGGVRSSMTRADYLQRWWMGEDLAWDVRVEFEKVRTNAARWDVLARAQEAAAGYACSGWGLAA